MLWFSGQDGDVNVEKDPGLKEDLESGKAGSCFFSTTVITGATISNKKNM